MSILVEEGTQVLVQGITGREARRSTRQCLDYGTQVVAGVTPGKQGQDVCGVPVYDSVKEASAQHGLDATVISVPPFAVRDAALEAIENDIPLIVIITERVPRKDVCEILGKARQQGARVIGPNSLGIICPGKTKLGGVGGDLGNSRETFQKGPVAVLSRSGGMTAEIASLLSRSGIGQSACVSIGGDPIVGAGFSDLFPLLQDDGETEAVVLFCEPGGSMEEQFAEYYSAQLRPKPVAAFVGGRFVDSMPGVRFGHAGVIVEGDRGSTRSKIESFRVAGIEVVDKLSTLPEVLKGMLKSKVDH